MNKMIVNGHPSVAIVKSKESNLFLFSRYDETYPALPYRLAANTLGGNPKKGDYSPWSTWEREVREELNNEAPHGEELRDKTTSFAPLEEILKIRNAILENAMSHADFYFITLGLKMEDYLNGVGKGLSEKEVYERLPAKKRKEVEETGMITRSGSAIFSVFYSEIPYEEIERARHYISKGKRISTEGGNRILNEEELINGIEGEIEKNNSYLTAHCTPFIMQDFLGNDKPLHHLPGDVVIRKENVRATYNDYKFDRLIEYNLQVNSLRS